MGPEETADETALEFEAVLMELENVIADTTKADARAWERLADTYGTAVTEGAADRKQTDDERAAAILKQSRDTFDSKQDIIAQKETYYDQEVKDLSPRDILSGINPLLQDLKRNGVRIAAVSAHKQATEAIEQLGIGDFIDEIIDVEKIAQGQPLSEKFFSAAEHMDVAYEKCIAIVHVDDKWFQQEKKSSLFIVGIGREDQVEGTDGMLSNTGELSYEDLKKRFAKIH